MFGHNRESGSEFDRGTGEERHGRHEHCEGRHRHGRGSFGERWEGFSRGHGFGGGRERMFDNGQLKLVILQLLAEKPSYGYELIKAIEERLSGGYAPSPGVVYPTLTLLEEEGLAEVAETNGAKKLYTATEAGKEHLKTNKVMVKAIFGRIEEAGRMFGRERAPQIERAVMNLRMALKLRVRRGGLTSEQTARIAEAIDTAARAIDEV
jgi:DNA-binding PadR family transcriptional regulator